MLRQHFLLPADAPMIIFARHGHSLANEIMEKDLLLPVEDRTLHYNFPFADHQIPLTNKGRRQARQLGRTLAKLFPPSDPIHRIFVSPFKRTRQTTTENKRVMPYKPTTIITPALAERSRGDLYGYSAKGLREHFPGFLEQWEDPERGMELIWPNGMTAKEFIARTESFTQTTLLQQEGVSQVNSHSFFITCAEVVLENPNRAEALRIYAKRRLINCELSIFVKLAPNAPFTRLPLDGLI